MKKRLRKKLHKGEFQELGFELKFETSPEEEPDDCYKRDHEWSFYSAFIDFIESLDLGFGGGCWRKWDGFVIQLGRGSVTEIEQEQIRAWLEARGTITNIEIGPLRDAWYGWDKD